MWGSLAELTHLVEPTDWVLVGGQMAALHTHIAGIEPARSTVDIILVANVVADYQTVALYRAAAANLGLSPVPVADGAHLQRFKGAR